MLTRIKYELDTLQMDGSGEYLALTQVNVLRIMREGVRFLWEEFIAEDVNNAEDFKIKVRGLILNEFDALLGLIDISPSRDKITLNFLDKNSKLEAVIDLI